MRTKIREWLSSFILLWIPADHPPKETTPAPPETTPAPTETTPAPTETEPAPTETEPAPAETTPAAPEPDMVPRSELDAVRSEHAARVREEAERLLMETDPQTYPGPNQPPQPAEVPGEPQLEWGDMSDEQRQNFLHEQQQTILANQEQMHNQNQAQRLIGELERFKAGDFPEMDVRKCLEVLSRRPGARIEKLAEISHMQGIARGDEIAEERLQNPQFRESHGLPALDPNNPGGTPAPQTSVPGRTAPLLPGPGPTTTGAQPITGKNARFVLRDRLRASGFQDS